MGLPKWKSEDFDAATVKIKEEIFLLGRDTQLQDFLPNEIVEYFEYMSRSLGVSGLSFIPHILATASSMMGKANIRVTEEWSSPVLLYLILIGNKGSNKSGVLKYFKLHVQNIEKSQMKEAKKNFAEHAVDDGDTPNKKKHKGDEDKSDESLGKHLVGSQILVETGTQEGIFQVLSRNGGSALLLSDEYKTIIESVQKKSGSDGGTSEFLSRLIQIFDADDIRVNTKGGGFFLVEDPRLNISANIQVPTLLSLLLAQKDRQGFWDRHIMIPSPDAYVSFAMKNAPPPTGLNKIAWDEVLRSVKQSHTVPREYRITPEALALLSERHDAIQKVRSDVVFSAIGDDISGQQAKMFSALLRVAAVLRAIKEAMPLLVDGKFVSAEDDLLPQKPLEKQSHGIVVDQVLDDLIDDVIYQDREEPDRSDDITEFCGRSFTIDEGDIRQAINICNLSIKMFEILTKNASSITSNSKESEVKVLPDSSTADEPYLLSQVLWIADLYQSKELNENNESSLRKELRRGIHMTLGKNQKPSEELEKFLHVLTKFHILKYSVVQRGQRTDKTIKIPASLDEVHPDGLTILQKLNKEFKEVKKDEESPFAFVE